MVELYKDNAAEENMCGQRNEVMQAQRTLLTIVTGEMRLLAVKARPVGLLFLGPLPALSRRLRSGGILRVLWRVVALALAGQARLRGLFLERWVRCRGASLRILREREATDGKLRGPPKRYLRRGVLDGVRRHRRRTWGRGRCDGGEEGVAGNVEHDEQTKGTREK